MSTPHMLLPITHRPEGWQWRCTCGDRGHAVADRDTARRGHIVHKEQKRGALVVCEALTAHHRRTMYSIEAARRGVLAL